MTRLEDNLKRRSNHRIILYIVILIALIYFMFTFGIKLLVNSIVFLTSRNSNNTTNTQTQEEVYLLPPEILDIPVATNSATAKIAIRVTLAKKVKVFVNKEEFKSFTADKETYDMGIDLKKGENEVYLTLEDTKSKTKKQSSVFKVTYKSEKPKLDIASPKDGDKTSSDEISINGETDKDNEIFINDFPVVLLAEGKFSYSIRLSEGENKIKVVAKDNAGNTEEKNLTITYQKD